MKATIMEKYERIKPCRKRRGRTVRYLTPLRSRVQVRHVLELGSRRRREPYTG